MDDAISAADANRSFSSLLRRVRDGRSVVVTSHGKPIARIVPVGKRDDRAAEGARAALLDRLRAEPVVNVGRWMRHELYEDWRVRVALDTNVLAYAEGTNGAEMKEAALRLIHRLPVASVVLPVQALGELFDVLVLRAKRPADERRIGGSHSQRCAPLNTNNPDI
jgi:prevent-host-death family protein